MLTIRRKCWILLLIGVLMQPLIRVASAQTETSLRQVTVEGNRAYSQRKIVGWSGLQTGKPVTEEVIDNAALKILQALTAEGYYFCQIDSISREYTADSALVSLRIHLQEGERLIFQGLEIQGDTAAINEDFVPLARPDKPFFAHSLQSDLWDILNLKEEDGHPFARLDLKKLELDGDSISATARMTSGPQATLASIRIIGLKSTKPSVIARETRIMPGELYRPSKVARARERIRKLPFVESVSVPALVPLGSNQYDLLLQVEEARSNSFDGVVGYQPGDDDEEGVVTGLLDLSFLNLFGTGRKALIHWERASEDQQALQLFYEEPWILGLPFSLWGEFRQEILDSLYLERYVALGMTWPALEILSLKGSVFQEEVLPDSAGEVYGIYKSIEQGGAVEFEYDTRDYIDNPRRGIYYRSRFAASLKDYTATEGSEDVEIRHYETDINWSYPVIGRQVVNLQLHGRYLQSDEDPIPQPDLYRIGGAQTLRGYREDQFIGHLVAWSSLEYRLWLDKVSRIYLFFNQGYYEYEPTAGGGTKQWPWGYGLGFRQGTRLGILGFDFALGEGDVLSTAKVHFRLINRF